MAPSITNGYRLIPRARLRIGGSYRRAIQALSDYAQYMKGDRVEVVVAADDGSRTYEIVATRAGRRVEITTGRGIVEVVEVTRTGEPVRTARFMASRVVALVEHPASEARPARESSDSQGTGRV